MLVPYHRYFVHVRTAAMIQAQRTGFIPYDEVMDTYVLMKTKIRVTFRDLPGMCSLRWTSRHVLMKTTIRVAPFFRGCVV